MSLLLTVIAASAAFCALLAALLIRPIAGEQGYRRVFLVSNMVILFLAGYSVFPFLKLLFMILHYWLPMGSWLPAWSSSVLSIAVILALLIAFRRTLHQRLSRLAAAVKFPLILVAGVSLALIGWRLAAADKKIRDNNPAPTSSVAARKPNIILVTFDALSADEMSLYGYHLPTTPNLDAFGRECSFVFKKAVSAATWTRPAIGSLLTGKFPSNHRLINSDYFQTNTNPKPEESLPAVLKASGYRPVALVANWVYAHPYVNGLAPFFETKPLDFVAKQNLPFRWRISLFCFSKGLPLAHRFGIESLNWLGHVILENRAQVPGFFLTNGFPLPIPDNEKPFYPPELIFKDAEQYLADDDLKRDSRPLFLWLHVTAPHEPYLPPAPFKGWFLKSDELTDYDSQVKYLYREYEAREQPVIDRLRLRYDENLLYADNRFGDFFSFLRNTGRLADSVVIVTSDHGESFDHGYTGHGGPFFYNSLVHIPLMIHLPGQRTGKQIDGIVSQVDIAPTILDLAGNQVPSWMDGTSRKSSFAGKEGRLQPAFSMDLDGNQPGKITKGSLAVVEENYKYVRSLESGLEELYDQRADPDEVKNLVKALPGKADQFDRLLRSKFKMPGIYD